MIGTAKEIFHAMETIARNSKMAVSGQSNRFQLKAT